DKVVYHGKLGSQGERATRVRAISRSICEALQRLDLMAEVDLVAHLAKADLLSDMVGEFPELQGTMGAYYARHDGMSDSVAEAIEDHYKPRFAGDSLPRGEVGLVVALADKLETLTGLFGIGQRPTGDKDPFALRRNALGVIRILVERALPIPLDLLLDAAFKAFPEGMLGSAHTDLSIFIFERLAGWLREQGSSVQEIDAVLARNSLSIDLVPRQLAAVRAFNALPEASSLAAANKRIANILKKSDAVAAASIDEALLVEVAERNLNDALNWVRPLADSHFARGAYEASLRELAALKAPVDLFFEQVMVNAEDPALRANRLALLAQLHASMNRIADLSRLAS
ncbi:MAG: glycine--tRNA ligase subunit beta, partial [Burkholderiaceae bacterium]